MARVQARVHAADAPAYTRQSPLSLAGHESAALTFAEAAIIDGHAADSLATTRESHSILHGHDADASHAKVATRANAGV